MLASLLTTLALAIHTLASPALSTVHCSSEAPLAKVIESCTRSQTAALTFDDGPASYLEYILKTLRKANAKGTFFVNGNNYGCIYSEENAKRMRDAHDQGHMIASHTWAHRDLTTLTLDQIIDEMQRVDQALQRILGIVPAFMRPPYGNYNDLVRKAACARGQQVVIWDFDSRDSIGATAEESKEDYDKLIDKHPVSVLALNHETRESTAKEVVPHVIARLQAAGYELVTVAECLGMEPYRSVTESPPFDSNWTQSC